MIAYYDENKIAEQYNIDEEELREGILSSMVDDELIYPNSELLKIVLNSKVELNIVRANELKSFMIDDIFMSEDIIKTMAVQYNIASDDEVIEWIDINNQTVTFSKVELGALIKVGSQKVKEIYFKYRLLKNELLK